jgi:predicted ATP-grasp superfamily ATP-dependent carboligase
VLYEVHGSPPELTEPVLVLGMDGWVDAGYGEAGAVSALLTSIDTELLASFDDDGLLDHRSRRPVMHLVDGVNTGITWPAIQLRYGQSPNGRHLLVLVGPEPDLRWRAFSTAVVELAGDLGTQLVVGLGAFPAPVPHTRPLRLAATATTAELASRIGFVGGSIDVPAGIHAVLERSFADVAIPCVGVWARVPHYVAAMPYPEASAALLEKLAELTGVEVDAEGLHRAAAVTRERIDELIANSEEHASMVRQLEAQHDAEVGLSGFGPGPLPSGEEMAAELERFLRGERGDG